MVRAASAAHGALKSSGRAAHGALKSGAVGAHGALTSRLRRAQTRADGLGGSSGKEVDPADLEADVDADVDAADECDVSQQDV